MGAFGDRSRAGHASDPIALAPPGPVAFGPFVLDAGQARLLRDGAALPLNGRPLQVLALLAAHPGRLIDKGSLLDAVWGHRHVTESVLKNAVARLREALADDPAVPSFVETVPRRGYRFIASVQAVDETAAQPPAAMPSAPSEGSPATSVVEQTAGNLPSLATPLIGRESESALLGGLLAEHRLVTLTGLGGVGKTRLALAAAQAAPRPPDGRWFVRLDEIDDPAALAPRLAQALHLGSAATASAAALGRALAGQRLLLVLDNAEHLIGEVADLVASLLAAAPGLRLLVTSQLPLRLAGEHVLALAPLALPADQADARPAPEGYAAAGLLCERIRQLQPAWQPEPPDAVHIAAICRALDGVPLALELAAARVPLLGLAGVHARLDERFALLTRGPRDAAARHRTLSAALDWTFGLLSTAERAALQQLAMFAGSFAIEDALGVLEEGASGPRRPDSMDVIEELRARSLAVSEPGAPGAPPRLRLYDIVRRHTLAGMGTAGCKDAAQLRLLRWLCLRFKCLHETDLFVPLLHWLPAHRADAESLRAALRYGLDEHAPAEVGDLGVRLAASSLPFWYRSGQRAEGARWLEAARRFAAGRPAALSAEAATLLDHGHGMFVCYAQIGPPAEALEALLRARPALQAVGDRTRLYMSFYAEYQLCLRIAPRSPQPQPIEAAAAFLDPAWPPLAKRLLQLMRGIESRGRGDFAGFLRESERGLALCRAADGQAEAWTMTNAAGQAFALLGRIDEACALFATAVDGIRALGLLRGQVPLVAMGAALALRRGLDGDSRSRALEALRLLAADGMVWWLADALPWAALHDGRPADAARLQAWADHLAAGRGESRGWIFGGMRDALRTALGPAADAVDLSAGPMADAEAVELALGPGASAAVMPVDAHRGRA